MTNIINTTGEKNSNAVDNGKIYIHHKNNIHEYDGTTAELLIEISAFYKDNFKAFQRNNIITHVSLESYNLLKNLINRVCKKDSEDKDQKKVIYNKNDEFSNIAKTDHSGLFNNLVEEEKNFGNYKILSKLAKKPEDVFYMILNKLGNKNAAYDSYLILNILFKEKTNDIANEITSKLTENEFFIKTQYRDIKDSIIAVIDESKEVITKKILNALTQGGFIKEEKTAETREILDLFINELMAEITDIVRSIKQAKVFLNKIVKNAISIDQESNLDLLFIHLVTKENSKFTLDAKENAKQISLKDANLDCSKYFHLDEILESFDDFIFSDIKESVFLKIELDTTLINIKNYKDECESDKKVFEERIKKADTEEISVPTSNQDLLLEIEKLRAQLQITVKLFQELELKLNKKSE